ncbi:Protein kinase superfamily protein with octicosapeptide/Phox/Bem1p domain [Prunus dulcis]|uniref:Protein kinase superfamily protein with octicosapeptide/Phox/Bem1p domain n=1 Tax=Prunus dulcis TaxID=3755 RepID=A0A4Y1RW11_PRUDU|nr:Protein kinase superfamily protein with octicosapeptide/Phox/Bem1p domain [Prunus dulcis]
MAFDQNSFPKELRQLNVARTVADEPRIALATTTGRNPDGLFPNLALEVNSPNSIPVFYPSTVAEAGLVGVGYGNAMSGVPTWRPRIPVPVGHPGMNTAVAVGIGYSPNLGGRLGGNAVDLVSSSTTTTASGPSVCNFNMSNRVVGNGLDHGVNDMAVRFGYNPNLGNKVSGNVANQTGNDLTSGYGNNANFGNRVGGNGTDQASDDGGDDSVSGKKVKLLCSFGERFCPDQVMEC